MLESINAIFTSPFDFISDDQWNSVLRVIILLFVALPLLGLFRKWVRVFFTKNYNQHYGLLAGKVTFYFGLSLIVVMVLHNLGFQLAPLLGAAGIVGVALGFASQTSVSNVISGLFLIAEQPFKVDDIITVSGTTGIVYSIDTLSVKLRMFNNQFVRIPNETMIKSEVTNISRFPLRRVDVNISVAYKEDLNRVREVLFDVADKNPTALQHPEPLMIFDKFGNSSIDILFVAWAVREEFLKLRNSLNMDIKKRFDEEGIEIPFPHLSLYSGSASKPLPLDVAFKDQAPDLNKKSESSE